MADNLQENIPPQQDSRRRKSGRQPSTFDDLHKKVDKYRKRADFATAKLAMVSLNPSSKEKKLKTKK